VKQVLPGIVLNLQSFLQLKVETDCKPLQTYGRCVEITYTRYWDPSSGSELLLVSKF
jgi:hypothetical protein